MTGQNRAPNTHSVHWSGQTPKPCVGDGFEEETLKQQASAVARHEVEQAAVKVEIPVPLEPCRGSWSSCASMVHTWRSLELPLHVCTIDAQLLQLPLQGGHWL